MWDCQEDPVEVTVVGDMLLGTGDHMPEDAKEFALCWLSDDPLDGCQDASHYGFLACRLVYIGCHGDFDYSMVSLMTVLSKLY